MSCTMKLWEIVIAIESSQRKDTTILDNEFGFILGLRWKQLDLHIVFIDQVKVYDKAL